MSSPIVRGPDATGQPAGAADVDASADPELFMALQISLQEEQARQAAGQVRSTRYLRVAVIM